MIRVLLIDAVAEFRAELTHALVSKGIYDVVGEATSTTDAIPLARSLQPDLVIVDLDLPSLAGNDLISQLRREVDGARVVVSTRSGEHGLGPGDPRGRRDEIARLLLLVDDLATQSTPSVAIDLPNEPDSVSRSRRFVESWCRAWGIGTVLELALLVASELVTNAIVHGGGACELRLRLTSGALRVEVVDGGEGCPELVGLSDTAEGGRGLLIVSHTSRAWGVEDGNEGTKVIWAELPTG